MTMYRAQKKIFSSLLCVLVANLALFAAEPQSNETVQTASTLDLELLSRGRPISPLIWNNFRQTPLPPLNRKNGPTVSMHIQQGKFSLSLTEFLRLVVENSLNLEASRYSYLISQVDLLRARSGQAARGVPGIPVPGGLFSGAIGAGLGNTTNVSNQGTGGTSISASARQFNIGPRGTADPTFSINMSWDREVDPLNSTRVTGISTVAIPSSVLQTRFQQQLPFGTSYAIDFNMQRQSTTQARVLYNPAFTSYFSVQVHQPLLSGFGRAFTHRFVTLAENDRQFAVVAFEQELANTLASATDAYWDFVAFRERQRVAERALALADTIYQSTEQRMQIGVLASTELITAASRVATTRRDLIIAQTNTQLQEVRLKSLITKTIGPEIAGILFEPTDTFTGIMDTPTPTLDEAMKTVGRKPPVREATIALQNYEIAESFTRSNLRPTFSVFGEVNSHTLAPGVSAMFRQSLRYAYPEYAIGFSLNFSVRNRAAQADNVRARLELHQAQVVLDQARSNAAMNIKTAITNLSPRRSEVEAAQSAVAASEQTVEAEQTRWSEGYSTLDKVYQAQQDLVNAQTAEIQSRLNYAKALHTSQSAAGTFFVIHGIVPEEALKGSLWKGPLPN